MRSLIFSALAASAVAACASPSPSSSWQAASPPPVERALAPYRNGGLCGPAQEHEIYAPPEEDPRPRTVRRCVPVFLADLQRRGYEAECIVRFRLSESGKALSAAAECDAWSDAAHAPEWDTFAKAAFTRLAEMSVEQSLYSSGPGPDASTVFAQRISFRLR
jgi:hypothetical protein